MNKKVCLVFHLVLGIVSLQYNICDFVRFCLFRGQNRKLREFFGRSWAKTV